MQINACCHLENCGDLLSSQQLLFPRLEPASLFLWQGKNSGNKERSPQRRSGLALGLCRWNNSESRGFSSWSFTFISVIFWLHCMMDDCWTLVQNGEFTENLLLLDANTRNVHTNIFPWNNIISSLTRRKRPIKLRHNSCIHFLFFWTWIFFSNVSILVK